MKKTILVASLISLFAQPLFAQPQKGDWMIGASVANGQAYVSGTYNQFNLALNPNAGYFITNRFVVGTGIGLSYGKSGGSHFLGYSVSPFARYYFAKKEGIQPKKVYLFGEAGFSLGGYHYADKIGPGKGSAALLSPGIGAGLAYFILPNVSIEGLLKVKKDFRIDNNIPNNNMGVVPTASLGFQIYLPGRKKREKPVE